ncbi:MAG: hypothetical protein GY909_16145 [Oligoflexia bacterium]|nr:hypothetical protein [Oligoflexia bacterium]
MFESKKENLRFKSTFENYLNDFHKAYEQSGYSENLLESMEAYEYFYSQKNFVETLGDCADLEKILGHDYPISLKKKIVDKASPKAKEIFLAINPKKITLKLYERILLKNFSLEDAREYLKTHKEIVKNVKKGDVFYYNYLEQTVLEYYPELSFESEHELDVNEFSLRAMEMINENKWHVRSYPLRLGLENEEVVDQLIRITCTRNPNAIDETNSSFHGLVGYFKKKHLSKFVAQVVGKINLTKHKKYALYLIEDVEKFFDGYLKELIIGGEFGANEAIWGIHRIIDTLNEHELEGFALSLRNCPISSVKILEMLKNKPIVLRKYLLWRRSRIAENQKTFTEIHPQFLADFGFVKSFVYANILHRNEELTEFFEILPIPLKSRLMNELEDNLIRKTQELSEVLDKVSKMKEKENEILGKSVRERLSNEYFTTDAIRILKGSEDLLNEIYDKGIDVFKKLCEKIMNTFDKSIEFTNSKNTESLDCMIIRTILENNKDIKISSLKKVFGGSQEVHNAIISSNADDKIKVTSVNNLLSACLDRFYSRGSNKRRIAKAMGCYIELSEASKLKVQKFYINLVSKADMGYMRNLDVTDTMIDVLLNDLEMSPELAIKLLYLYELKDIPNNLLFFDNYRYVKKYIFLNSYKSELKQRIERLNFSQYLSFIGSFFGKEDYESNYNVIANKLISVGIEVFGRPFKDEIRKLNCFKGSRALIEIKGELVMLCDYVHGLKRDGFRALIKNLKGTEREYVFNIIKKQRFHSASYDFSKGMDDIFNEEENVEIIRHQLSEDDGRYLNGIFESKLFTSDDVKKIVENVPTNKVLAALSEDFLKKHSIEKEEIIENNIDRIDYLTRLELNLDEESRLKTRYDQGISLYYDDDQIDRLENSHLKTMLSDFDKDIFTGRYVGHFKDNVINNIVRNNRLDIQELLSYSFATKKILSNHKLWKYFDDVSALFSVNEYIDPVEVMKAYRGGNLTLESAKMINKCRSEDYQINDVNIDDYYMVIGDRLLELLEESINEKLYSDNYTRLSLYFDGNRYVLKSRIFNKITLLRFSNGSFKFNKYLTNNELRAELVKIFQRHTFEGTYHGIMDRNLELIDCLNLPNSVDVKRFKIKVDPTISEFFKFNKEIDEVEVKLRFSHGSVEIFLRHKTLRMIDNKIQSLTSELRKEIEKSTIEKMELISTPKGKRMFFEVTSDNSELANALELGLKDIESTSGIKWGSRAKIPQARHWCTGNRIIRSPYCYNLIELNSIMERLKESKSDVKLIINIKTNEREHIKLANYSDDIRLLGIDPEGRFNIGRNSYGTSIVMCTREKVINSDLSALNNLICSVFSKNSEVLVDKVSKLKPLLDVIKETKHPGELLELYNNLKDIA